MLLISNSHRIFGEGFPYIGFNFLTSHLGRISGRHVISKLTALNPFFMRAVFRMKALAPAGLVRQGFLRANPE